MHNMLQSKYRNTVMLLAVSLHAATTLSAKTHVVIVRDNSFNPATVVIEAGDTVRWVNEGPGAHNIYSVGRFRCADGCEAEGGDGTPSSGPWVSEVTFRLPDTVPYECQPHVGFGMVGTVVVQAPVSGTTYQLTAHVDNTFDPDDLTLLAGDVLLVNNQGGVHNFTTDDSSILCADGCMGDGMNVDTSPTGFPWEFYLRLNQVGEFPYHCANPSHNGQVGILRVLSDVFFKTGFESP